MSGWPSRISLASLGPHPRQNFGAVRGDDRTSFNAEFLNLNLWQMVGAGLMVPKATLVIATVDNAAPTVVEHHEVWRPHDDGPAPTTARSAEGVFTFTFAAVVQDMDGNDVSPDLKWVGPPALQASTLGTELRALVTAPNVVTLYAYSSGVASDVPGSTILLQVW